MTDTERNELVEKVTDVGAMLRPEERQFLITLRMAFIRSIESIGYEIVKKAEKPDVVGREFLTFGKNVEIVTLTREMLNACRTPRNGFTRGTILALGLTWPLEHGWLRRLVGTKISKANYERAVACRLIRGKQK